MEVMVAREVTEVTGTDMAGAVAEVMAQGKSYDSRLCAHPVFLSFGRSTRKTRCSLLRNDS